MAEVDGATVIARSLKEQGVDYMFGIVGFPVIPVALAAQREGIKFYGFRNEQAASYAAAAVGYLTGRPGACLAVSGPGMIHGIAGLANAWSNCWPMILLGGANDSFQNGMGAFQEAPQIEAARPFVKYAARPDSLRRVPYYIEQAVRTSIYGRPGATYIDLPNDIIVGKIDEADVDWKRRCPDPPRVQADPDAVVQAVEALKTAERPLVIIGKGAAYARAENEVRAFIEKTQLPFIASPMGKGVVPDDHPLLVQPARSTALQQADLIFLMGARLNWIMHFGLPPRFNKDVRVIQMDIHGEEIGTNVPAEVALVGDAKAVTAQLNAVLDANPWSYPQETTWWTQLHQKMAENKVTVDQMYNDDSEPMNYYRVLREIRDLTPKDAIISSEGANTMDIGRTVLNNYLPRHRLDAGSFGTMGVGLGQAIAAAAVHPDKKIICVEGDSAFGFSGMEVETACRYRLPITFIIINNNGIGGGPSELDPNRIPPNAYTPNARYEKMIEGFGGKGYFVTKVAELRPALEEAMASDMPTIVNIMINPRANRKPQQFAWLTR
ncbi:MAG: oxalyl-CoA decarboxylase [Dehalococcoidia bacterium]